MAAGLLPISLEKGQDMDKPLDVSSVLDVIYLKRESLPKV